MSTDENHELFTLIYYKMKQKWTQTKQRENILGKMEVSKRN